MTKPATQEVQQEEVKKDEPKAVKPAAAPVLKP